MKNALGAIKAVVPDAVMKDVVVIGILCLGIVLHTPPNYSLSLLFIRNENEDLPRVQFAWRLLFLFGT